MLSFIRNEVVEKNHWLDDETFIDGITAAQSCPGPIAVNISIYTGYHIAGRIGVTLAVLGTVLPSMILIIIIASTFERWAQYETVQKVFRGLRPCVTALIAVPILQMGKSAQIRWKNVWLTIGAVILIAIFSISPLYLIVLTILGSWWKILFNNLKTKWNKDDSH